MRHSLQNVEDPWWQNWVYPGTEREKPDEIQINPVP
jgi:hypothetical protein